MAMDLTVAERVAAVVKEHLGLSETPQQDDTLVDDLDADSLDLVEVCMAMEDNFHVKISDDEAGKCFTVGDWSTLITSKLGA